MAETMPTDHRLKAELMERGWFGLPSGQTFRCPHLFSTVHCRTPEGSAAGKGDRVGRVPVRTIWGHSEQGGLDSRGRGHGELQTREKGDGVHILERSLL